MQKALFKIVLGCMVLGASGCCGSATYSARGSYTAGTSGSAGHSQQPQTRPTEPVPSTPTTPSTPPPVVEQPDPGHGGEGRPVRPRPERPTTPPGHGGVGVPVVNPRPTPPTEELPPFGTTDPIDNALTGNIYFLPSNTQRLPDLTRMEPVGQVYTRRIDIPERRFSEGFPGVTDRFEWFAIRYTGRVGFATAGTYNFRLKSDDGARLWIDGVLVVDNDGVHATSEKRGSINLTAGPHDVVIEYFQGPRHQIALQLFMTAPGGREAIFSLE